MHLGKIIYLSKVVLCLQIETVRKDGVEWMNRWLHSPVMGSMLPPRIPQLDQSLVVHVVDYMILISFFIGCCFFVSFPQPHSNKLPALYLSGHPSLGKFQLRQPLSAMCTCPMHFPKPWFGGNVLSFTYFIFWVHPSSVKKCTHGT